MKLSLSRLDESRPEWIDAGVEAMMAVLAGTFDRTDGAIDIIVVDDSYIRDINRRFRNTDTATDVISFSYADGEAIVEEEADSAGEIYISYETIEREANERGVDRAHLFLRTAVHGLMHIHGFDHLSDEEAERMEAAERAALAAVLSERQIEPLFG
ncbi:MAG: rRNA maturation RNase YbeY [Chitinivibrionia bacterium]|nr:rRNA maturation RNase YbeY [Chitinivibrionia bacterium]